MNERTGEKQFNIKNNLKNMETLFKIFYSIFFIIIWISILKYRKQVHWWTGNFVWAEQYLWRWWTYLVLVWLWLWLIFFWAIYPFWWLELLTWK